MTSRKTFLLFDLDGTLLNLGWDAPEIAGRRARIREIVRELGINPSFGMMVPALAEIGRHKPWVAQALEDLELAAAERARECGGALRLIAALSGLPLALVTSNGRACIARAMAVVGLPQDAFGAIVCRDDVTRFKPEPDSLLKAVAALQKEHGEPPRTSARARSARAPGIHGPPSPRTFPAVAADHLGQVADAEVAGSAPLRPAPPHGGPHG